MSNHLPLSNRSQALLEALKNRILLLDGGMGTMIQKRGLAERDYHPECGCCHGVPEADVTLKGCNDLLVLSRPDVIKEIHLEYLAAGADIIETDSFNANAISLAEYGMGSHAREISLAATRVACLARDEYERLAGRRCWVAGSVGPTSKSLTMAANLGEDIDFAAMRDVYVEQIQGLIEGGADMLVIETCYDILNAKAALVAARSAMESAGREVPVMVSATVDTNGRTLSGMTLGGFAATVGCFGPMALGMNCGFGADEAVAHIAPLESALFAVALYPNAGLPNELGEYDQTPEQFVAALKPLIDNRRLNIVGGCCGTTPRHIVLLADAVRGKLPRAVPAPSGNLLLSGLEPLELADKEDFIDVGERCNVAGSRKFLRLISEGNYEEALQIARAQIAAGARVIDLNMDDGMLDTAACMKRFLQIAATDPDVARVPVMIDSSDFDVIRMALTLIQGRPVVNSISLKEGEAKFRRHAREIHRMGGAMVVMAFDEQGQAVTPERRIEVCRRSYDILTREEGIPPCDIIFDPNILAVATGIPEHDSYAADFLAATEWITANLPGCNVSGGLSNLSFSFRGNDPVRKAMHSIFISMARRAGMRLAIVNPSGLQPVESITPDLREAIADVLRNSDPDATERLIAVAQKYLPQKKEPRGAAAAQSELSVPDALVNAVLTGVSAGVTDLLAKALESGLSPIGIIDDILMKGMDTVGKRFGAGETFLPQVVKSAAVMKECVAFLTPYIEQMRGNGGSARAYRMVLATVKGDVHDIGKNIVAVVMRCNGFEVIDLGVMVAPQDIIDAARKHQADCVGVSGLITPSLGEMATLASMMEQQGLRVPLFVGGATTSPLHTAVKLAPEYSGGVIHTADAADLASKARLYVDPQCAAANLAQLREQQQRMREDYSADAGTLTPGEARKLRPDYPVALPQEAPELGSHRISIPVAELTGLVNKRQFLSAWGISAQNYAAPEAESLLRDADAMLSEWSKEGVEMTAGAAVYMCAADDEDNILVFDGETPVMQFHAPRQSRLMERAEHTLSLADYLPKVNVNQRVPVAFFAVTAGEKLRERLVRDPQSYEGLMADLLLHRLAEAATQYLHARYAPQLTGYPSGMTSIRPAVGYPSLPDQMLTHKFAQILNYKDLDISLTENGAMSPAATTTGIIIFHPRARYFSVK